MYNTGEMASMIAAMKVGANYPPDVVAGIVADDYISVLPFSAAEAIAVHGLHGADRRAIAETIRTEGLGVTVAEVGYAIIDACEARVERNSDALHDRARFTD